MLLNISREFTSNDAPILLGRTEHCKIKFEDPSLSRIQCRIDYIGEKWYIKDGNGEKGSMNGTWIFAEDEIKLEPDTIIKSGESLFKVNMLL